MNDLLEAKVQCPLCILIYLGEFGSLGIDTLNTVKRDHSRRRSCRYRLRPSDRVLLSEDDRRLVLTREIVT